MTWMELEQRIARGVGRALREDRRGLRAQRRRRLRRTLMTAGALAGILGFARVVLEPFV